MRTLHHPDKEHIKLTAVFYALSEPVRLGIVLQLRGGIEKSCGEFVVEERAKSTLSHHFKTLRECGVIRTRAVGTQRFISLRERDLNERFPGLLDALFAATEPL
jgi:DNA-binding transcriptional ArsR family regulator